MFEPAASAPAQDTDRNPAPKPPGSIGLDWGTTNLRAFLLGSDGVVMEQRERPWGILSLPAPSGAGGFDQALAGIAGDWLAAHPDIPLIASGMVGSAQGWLEAPYLECPAGASELSRRLATVKTANARRLHIVPGLLLNHADTLPDVIRGEETQVIGALAAGPPPVRDLCFVLPGTHSKWVQVRNQRIVQFATYMTGEVFATLKQHSILGRLMPTTVSTAGDSAAGDAAAEEATAESAAAYAKGLALARDSGPGDLLRQLFTVRSMHLAGRLPVTVLSDYLSGLLIGHELVSATAWLQQQAGADTPIVLIGESALLTRYTAAFAASGLKTSILGNTAAAGLHQLINLAGLR